MNKEQKINFVADKILDGISDEKGFIDIAIRQKKRICDFKEIYKLARQQIIKELKEDKKNFKKQYEFYKNGECKK